MKKETLQKIVRGVVVVAAIITTADQTHEGINNVKKKIGEISLKKKKDQEA
jgi:hypothetical protein